MDWGNCVENGVATLRCIPVIFSNIINTIFLLAGMVAVFFITISGIKLVTSGGDPVKVSEAKRTLTFAVIGLVVVLVSFGILRVIATVTGTECIRMFGFDSCI